MPSLWPMSCRFFFHVRRGADLIEDRIGEYHADAEEAHLRARIMARELLDRGACHPSCIVIMDDYGHELDAVAVAVPAKAPVAAADTPLVASAA